MKRVIILGSTGSIGTQTLNVISRNLSNFKVVGLSCNSNIELLNAQREKYGVEFACCKCLPDKDKGIFATESELIGAVKYDILVAASGGVDSLDAVVTSLLNGKAVCIANKELLVCAGEHVMAASHKGRLIPVDSEHSAIYQCLQGESEIDSVTLTCSGGALRNMPIEKLSDATVEDVLKHPNWVMGKKITVDCATMMNKAFEVIEAMCLFGLPKEKVHVVMHKESLVHGYVTFKDGSIKALISPPNMELPIAYALNYPNRIENINFDLSGKTLTFTEPDIERYPLFKLVLDNLDKPLFPSFIAGVDEIVVDHFLKGFISYGEMHKIINRAVLMYDKVYESNANSYSPIGLYECGRKVVKKLLRI